MNEKMENDMHNVNILKRIHPSLTQLTTINLRHKLQGQPRNKHMVFLQIQGEFWKEPYIGQFKVVLKCPTSIILSVLTSGN